MIAAIVWLLVLLAVLAVACWAIQQLTLPPNVKTLAYVVLAIIAIIVIAKILLGLVGAPPGF